MLATNKEFYDYVQYLLKSPVLQSEDFHYLTPKSILQAHTSYRSFGDQEFEQLIDCLVKHALPLEELFPIVYHHDQLTVKSLQLLLDKGVDIQTPNHQKLLIQPPLYDNTHDGYEKTVFLIGIGLDVNAVRDSLYYETIKEHAFDNICNSSQLNIPYLLLFRFNFSATYESHKVFHLSLTLKQYLEKTFQCMGLHYWMYCFTPPKYDLVATIPFFEPRLQRVAGIHLKTFCEKRSVHLEQKT